MAVWRYDVRKINTQVVIPKEFSDDPDPDIIRFEDHHLQDMLNEMGEEGWELVGFLPAMPSKNFQGDEANPWSHYLVCKRSEAPEETHTRRQYIRKGPGRLPA